jgi:hypothetical protein
VWKFILLTVGISVRTSGLFSLLFSFSEVSAHQGVYGFGRCWNDINLREIRGSLNRLGYLDSGCPFHYCQISVKLRF